MINTQRRLSAEGAISIPPLPRITTIYAHNHNRHSKERLTRLGITNAGLIEKHRIGYSNNKLKNMLPKEGAIITDLTAAGILNKNKTERFNTCLTFPIYDIDRNLITLIGHKPERKSPVLINTAVPPIWNLPILKTATELIITSSVLDSLSLEMAGYNNTIAVYEPNSLTADTVQLLSEHNIQKITLLTTTTQADIQRTEKFKDLLSTFTLIIKHLPNNLTPNAYLLKHGPKKMADQIASDKNTTTIQPAAIQPHATRINGFEHSFVVTCCNRDYRIMGLDKGLRKLKATIRVEHAGRLHVDTLDLYSANARRTLSKDLSRILEHPQETIDNDITTIILACENKADNPDTKEPDIPDMTEQEKDDAQKLGTSKNLIKTILTDFETCGIIGEDANKLLGYIAMTSRKLPQPLSMLILSGSGAGKSALQDAIVAFCPPEDLVKLTSLTGKALFYKGRQSLKHKVLAIEEARGAETATYALRNLISSGVLVSETTVKDLSTGRLTTMETGLKARQPYFTPPPTRRPILRHKPDFL